MTKHTAASTDANRLVRRLVIPAIAFAAFALTTAGSAASATAGETGNGIVVTAEVPEPDPRVSSDWPW